VLPSLFLCRDTPRLPIAAEISPQNTASTMLETFRAGGDSQKRGPPSLDSTKSRTWRLRSEWL